MAVIALRDTEIERKLLVKNCMNMFILFRNQCKFPLDSVLCLSVSVSVSVSVLVSVYEPLDYYDSYIVIL